MDVASGSREVESDNKESKVAMEGANINSEIIERDENKPKSKSRLYSKVANEKNNSEEKVQNKDESKQVRKESFNEIATEDGCTETEKNKIKNNDSKTEAEDKIQIDNTSEINLNEANEKEKKSKWFGNEDRDPSKITGNIKLEWSSLFAEPKDIRSLSLGWILAEKIYNVVQGIIYVLLALIFGPIFVLAFAIIVALLAFMQIWCWVPCVGVCNVVCEAAPCSEKVQSCCQMLADRLRPKPVIPGGIPGGDVVIDIPTDDLPILIP